MVSVQGVYSPLITLKGMDFKLTEQEIEALVQEVMVVCHREKVLTNYDPNYGRFRSYLRAVIARCAIRLIANRPSDVRLSNEQLEALEAEDLTRMQLWEAVCEEHLKEMALEELRKVIDPLHYMAFEMHALNHQSAADVAACLNLSTDQVYVICTRCTQRLSDIVR